MLDTNPSTLTNLLSLRRPALRAALAAVGLLALVACGSRDDDAPVEPLLDDPAGGSGGDSSMDPPMETEDPTESAPGPGDPAPNGIELPEDLFDWAVLGAASRTDNGSIRVALGNSVAAAAARSGDTNPWPDGTMIADLVWSGGSNESWSELVAPDAFGTLLLMVKDEDANAADGGWGYASWSGADLVPAADPSFDRACADCHATNAADNDYVFTRPGQLPDSGQIAGAEDAPNGLELPDDFRDWRLLGVGQRTDNGSVRVVVGNDAAVDAARSGQPWSDGAMIANIVWSGGDNPDWEEVIVPSGFGTLLFMAKDSAQYAADGGWAYANWSGMELASPAASDFDRACVNCHVDSAANTDYVFTIPAPLD